MPISQFYSNNLILNTPKMPSNKDLNNTMASSMTSLHSSASVDNLNPNDRLKCSSGNYAVKICLNQNCIQKNLFQCLTAQCKCRQLHKKCTMANTQCIREYVNSKIHNTKPLCDSIEALINKKIQQLNNLRLILLKLVDEKYKYSKLLGVERKFFDLQQGNVQLESFTLSDSSNIWDLAKLDLKNAYDISDVLNSILTSDGNAITKSINSIKQKFTNQLSAQSDYLKQMSKKNITKTLDKNDLQISQQIATNSAICQTKDLSQSLIRMFGMFGKQPNKIELLFSASKNNFSIKKYFDVCGKIPNTVIMVKTEYDKVIGAYTPLVHDQDNNNNDVSDDSKQSFIFSLTDKEIFFVKDSSRTIYRSKARNEIQFGTNEFQIGDKKFWGKSCDCRADFNYKNYYCPSYSTDCKWAYQKFSGSNACQFQAKEWEVWKVEFAGQNPA